MSVAIGMPHPSAPGPPALNADVDERRHGHPTDRGDGGECGLARVAELALHELAFDLEADDEEEHRHEPVVHPRAEGERQVVVAVSRS